MGHEEGDVAAVEGGAKGDAEVFKREVECYPEAEGKDQLLPRLGSWSRKGSFRIPEPPRMLKSACCEPRVLGIEGLSFVGLLTNLMCLGTESVCGCYF